MVPGPRLCGRPGCAFSGGYGSGGSYGHLERRIGFLEFLQGPQILQDHQAYQNRGQFKVRLAGAHTWSALVLDAGERACGLPAYFELCWDHSEAALRRCVVGPHWGLHMACFDPKHNRCQCLMARVLHWRNDSLRKRPLLVRVHDLFGLKPASASQFQRGIPLNCMGHHGSYVRDFHYIYVGRDSHRVSGKAARGDEEGEAAQLIHGAAQDSSAALFGCAVKLQPEGHGTEAADGAGYSQAARDAAIWFAGCAQRNSVWPCFSSAAALQDLESAA
mmetsp:Transcript_66723/g.159549  ORF Transcript_66723/g.159549 Transcript_66723/m.159549 type:complete len:275 (+) Transcript_66723:900-1724(+)